MAANTSVADTTSAAVRQPILITYPQMKRTVMIVQTNIFHYCISKDLYLIVVYWYWSCIHASFVNCSDLQPNWYKGAAVTVHHTQLPLSNWNSHLHCHCGFYFYWGYYVCHCCLWWRRCCRHPMYVDRDLVNQSIKVTSSSSSSYRHQLSPSSRHRRGGANKSSAYKDVSNWSSSLTFIADHEPLTELCVWCIKFNPTRPGCPFFVATKDSRPSRYPHL